MEVRVGSPSGQKTYYKTGECPPFPFIGTFMEVTLSYTGELSSCVPTPCQNFVLAKVFYGVSGDSKYPRPYFRALPIGALENVS